MNVCHPLPLKTRAMDLILKRNKMKQMTLGKVSSLNLRFNGMFYYSLKWQSLSLDYLFLMLILPNHYMFIEVMWYLHDNK